MKSNQLASLKLSIPGDIYSILSIHVNIAKFLIIF